MDKKSKGQKYVFQQDPFHQNKTIKEKIHHEKAMSNVMELLSKNIGELFDYLETYKNRLEEKREIENAQNLIYYYENNLEGLLSYHPTGFGSARVFRRIGVPKYGDDGESCIGCGSQTNEE